MKRVFLILLFILINFRILQQLYFRANVVQNIQNKPTVTSNESAVGSGAMSVDFDLKSVSKKACNERFSTYSDIYSSQFDDFNHSIISSHGLSYDRAYFSGKRLVFRAKDVLCKAMGLSSVWKTVFTSYREGFLSSVESGFRSIYHPSISDVIMQLVLGRGGSGRATNYHLFKITGTQHLFSISGFHLSFFIAFVTNLYGRFFSKATVIFLNVVICTLYVCLVGNSPGLLRSFLMFLLSTLAWYTNRQKRALYSLFSSFLIAILLDIQSLYSIGFQLSYMATFGILVFAKQSRFLSKAAEGLFMHSPQVFKNIQSYFVSSFFISCVAQLAVFPLLIYHFQEFSLVGIIATSLVAWTIPIILQLSLVFIVAQLFLPISSLIIFSVPLFCIASLLFFLLKMVAFENTVLIFPEFTMGSTIVLYVVLAALYVLFLLIKQIINRKKYEKIYHFCL